MNINHPQPITLAIVALTLAACQTTAPNRFEQADTNRDQALSLDETNAYLVGGIFSARDANRDNQLTRTEWLASNDPGEEKSFRDRDANGDGVVTMDEALAYGRRKGMAEQLLREADSDKDGRLSSGEITGHYASREGPAR